VRRRVLLTRLLRRPPLNPLLACLCAVQLFLAFLKLLLLLFQR